MDASDSQPAQQSSGRERHSAPLCVRHSEPQLIRVTGSDRLDFVNRMSTNQFAGVAPGVVLPTVFTTPLGRVIDSARVIIEPECLLLHPSPGRSPALLDWLRQHIFFQDDVSCEPALEFRSFCGIYGLGALTALQAVIPEAGPLQPAGFERTEGALIWRVDLPLDGYQVLLHAKAHDRAEREWSAIPESSPAFEALRIEAGLPHWGREITQDSIPLEVGLWDAVSFTKGCYIGQEIIARMESRGKLAKQLVGVRLAAKAKPGDDLRQGGRRIGGLTSVAHSEHLGWIGLGLAKPRSLSANGGRVEIGEAGGTAQLVELPAGIAGSREASATSDPTGG